MNIVVYPIEQTSVTAEQVVDLLHESFEERLRTGLHYTLCDIDVLKYAEKFSKSTVFVALDGVGSLVGTVAVSIYGEYSYLDFWAVSEKEKKKGIGKVLFNQALDWAKKHKARFMMSDTAVKADSAIKAHLRQGFQIVGLESYRSTNYYSYIFRLQFYNDTIWSNRGFCKLHFFLSAIKIHILKKEDGSRRLTLLTGK